MWWCGWKAGGRLKNPNEKGRCTVSTENYQIDLSIPMLSEMELAAAHVAEAVTEFMKLGTDQVDETVMALIEACLYTFQKNASGERAHICFCLVSKICG